MYKPWIFYHLGPTFFVDHGLKPLGFQRHEAPEKCDCWISPTTIKSLEQAIPESEMVWFQVWIWHTFHMFPMCSKKYTKRFLVIEIPASPSLFSTTWQEKGCKRPIYHPWSLQIEVILMSLLFAAWCLYMFAATPRFARSQSRISFDMSNPFAGFKFFIFQNPLNLKP